MRDSHTKIDICIKMRKVVIALETLTLSLNFQSGKDICSQIQELFQRGLFMKVLLKLERSLSNKHLTTNEC